MQVDDVQQQQPLTPKLSPIIKQNGDSNSPHQLATNDTPHFNSLKATLLVDLSGGKEGMTQEINNGHFTPARRPSIDSISSYNSSEIILLQNGSGNGKQKKSRMVIKKNLMKQASNTRVFTQATAAISNTNIATAQQIQDPFERTQSQPNPAMLSQPLQGQILGTQQYMSHTDHSDSELSFVLENQSDNGQGLVRQNQNPSSALKFTPQQMAAAQKLQYNIQLAPESARSANQMNSLNSSLFSNGGMLGFIQGDTATGMPPVFRLETDQATQQNVKFLNKTTQQRPQYHPFADKLSPFEEWKHTTTTVLETVFQFCLHDIFYNACYYTWQAIFYVTVLVPFAIFGLFGHFLRNLKNKFKKRKEKKEPSPFAKFPKPPANNTAHLDTPLKMPENDENSELSSGGERRRRDLTVFQSRLGNQSPPIFETKGDFIIVVDLDKTLIYSQLLQNADSRPLTSLNDSYVTVQSLGSLNGVAAPDTPHGGTYYVYKRPLLDKFLKAMSIMGELHIFTASARSYADPIIDVIDPQGFITGRYYREHCTIDKKGSVIKPMEIITKNMKKLIIIDDSEQVYNMYRENTIMVEAWTPGMGARGRKQDRALQYCIDVLEQLRCVANLTDVRKSLRSIIDTAKYYRH